MYAYAHTRALISAKVSLTGQTLTLSGGDLPEDYIFAQLHFHWGTTDSEGSEHTVDGHEYPLEVRIHSNNVYKYKS